MPKFNQVKSTVGAVISDAMGILQELRDEIVSWRDNLEEKLSNTPKYEEVSECADTLDNVADNEPDVPEPADGLVIEYSSLVKRRQSRSDRRDEAINMLEGAVEALEARIDELEEADASEDEEDEKSVLETLRDELDEIIDGANEANFPGMY